MSKETGLKLSRNMSLFSVTMIGVGAMIGAGIFVLTGIAAGLAGPAIILVFIFNGIVAFFTASTYAELGASLPEAGGGYLWVKNSLPHPSGFLSGWMSWMAHSVACSLYAAGFSAYFIQFLNSVNIKVPLPYVVQKSLVGLFIVFLFSYINYRGAKETGRAESVVTVMKVLILLVFGAMGLALIFKEPVRLGHFSPFFSEGTKGILIAMGLTYIAFEGYEIIAQSGEEIVNPKKNIPKAIFYSLLIVVPIYVLVAFVALGVSNPVAGQTAWAYLAVKKEVAILEAATNISQFGGIIVMLGGLLSTVSALNATIYSSSRVAFAMGRDYNFPEFFATIHKKYKTPTGSIIASSVLISAMFLFLPIEDIAASADVMFLFLFILVNFSLIHIRRNNPRVIKGYRSPLFPLFPVLGILTQMVLIMVLFWYSPKAFLTTFLWIGMGVSVFYGYSRFHEKEEVGPRVIIEEREIEKKEYTVVVAIKDTYDMMQLMNIAVPIAKGENGDIVVTSIIHLPDQTPLHAGKRFIESRRKLLKLADNLGEKQGVPVNINIIASHRVDQGIVSSVEEYKADALILGMSERERRGKILGRVLEPTVYNSPGDVGILQLSNNARPPVKLLVPTAGGPNARLAFKWAYYIATHYNGRVSLLYVAKDQSEQRTAERWLAETKKAIEFDPGYVEEKILYRKNIAQVLLTESNSYDLVVIGASNEPIYRRIRLGTIPEKLARHARPPVLIVKKYEGPILSWIRRFVRI